MQSTVKFDDGTTSVTVNGPNGATRPTSRARTVSELTAGYKRRSYKFTSKKFRQWRMTLNDLTASQYRGLEDFFYDTVDGTSKTFSYTHTDGTTYNNVRFAMDEIAADRDNSNVYQVPIVLEFEGTQIQ